MRFVGEPMPSIDGAPLPARDGASGEVALGLQPALPGGDPSGRPRVEVALLEVDAAVAPREPRLVRGRGEGRPGQCQVASRDETRLDARALSRERHRAAEAVATREEPEDLGAGGAEVAVSGGVLRERRRREEGRLVGEPRLAVDRLGAPAGPAPGADPLAGEEVADGGDRPHRVEGALVVPGAAASVEDRVRQGEEELDRLVEVVLAVAAAIAVRDLLGEQV